MELPADVIKILQLGALGVLVLVLWGVYRLLMKLIDRMTEAFSNLVQTQQALYTRLGEVQLGQVTTAAATTKELQEAEDRIIEAVKDTCHAKS